MGEYARRKDNGQEIKIGTCENMYYLRFEDRNKVEKLHCNLDPSDHYGLAFRLPFPDEDGLGPGQIKEGYERFVPLVRDNGNGVSYFETEGVEHDVGNLQVKHEPSGLLINVSCYHGTKLPENSKDAHFHWNGKGYSLVLVRVKSTHEGLKPQIMCRHCRQMWWMDNWDEALPFVMDSEMRKRLEAYANEQTSIA